MDTARVAMVETPEFRMIGRRERKLDPEILGEAGGLFKSFLDDGARHEGLGRAMGKHGLCACVPPALSNPPAPLRLPSAVRSDSLKVAPGE